MANRNKATHDGECQICGCRQRLPNGLMAKHGYTVQWGFFSGVCPGSDHLPWQQSKDLVERQCMLVRKQIAELKVEIKELQTKPLEGNKVWKHEYFPGYGYGHSKVPSGYRWVEVEVQFTEHENDGHKWNELRYLKPEMRDTWGEKQPERWTRFDYYGDKTDKTKFFIDANTGYIKHLQEQVGKRKQYLDWQAKRCAEWTEKPLWERMK
jgi:hypothetical protein